MKIVIAPDSFKECLSSKDVCEAMADGIRRHFPEDELLLVPLADGGEGTVDAVVAALPQCRRVRCEVEDALKRPVMADFAYDAASQTAYIEAASACGLELIPVEQREPMVACTAGVGQLLQAAIAAGARRVVLGIGGTATVDGGTGMARALGIRFLNDQGEELPPGGGALSMLGQVIIPETPIWEGVELVIASDVTNPLLGQNGAATVFAPQKGATPEQVQTLERGLGRLAEVWATVDDASYHNCPGAGAAGGLGFGLTAFCGARMEQGIGLILELLDLRGRLAGADLVITGEGCTDSQTVGGKACAGVAQLAADCGVPCVVLSGAVLGKLETFKPLGVHGLFAIGRGPQSLSDAYARAAEHLAESAANVVSIFRSGRESMADEE